MKILVDKSSVYLRTDLTPIAHYIFVTESLVRFGSDQSAMKASAKEMGK